MNIKDKYFIVH